MPRPLFNEEQPYQSFIRFTEKHHHLGEPDKRMFWQSVQDFFTRMAFNNQFLRSSIEDTNRFFKVDLPKFFEVVSGIEGERVDALKWQLLANIYKVTANIRPVDVNEVYQISVRNSDKPKSLLWGWIRPDFVSEKLKKNLNEQGIICVDTTAKVVSTLQRFQEFLFTEEQNRVLDIPLDCLIELLEFSVEWELDALINILWPVTCKRYNAPKQENNDRMVRFQNLERTLNDPKEPSISYKIEESPKNGTTSPLFNPIRPYKSLKRYAKRCSALPCRDQCAFEETVKLFFSRAAYFDSVYFISDDYEKRFYSRDFRFFLECGRFEDKEERHRLINAVYAVAKSITVAS